MAAEQMARLYALVHRLRVVYAYRFRSPRSIFLRAGQNKPFLLSHLLQLFCFRSQCYFKGLGDVFFDGLFLAHRIEWYRFSDN